MSHTRAFALAAFTGLVAATPLAAQRPFGVATPAGGPKAELFAEPLWLGNVGYGYRIENGPPGGAALLVVSVARQDTTLLGLQLYPSLGPGDVVVTDSGTLDASGRLALSRPLAGPEIPALAGLCLYAQAAVAGPSGLGSTQGLVLEATLHPMLAFGQTYTGIHLIDLVLGTATPIVGLPAISAHAAVFANGGRDLFLAAAQGLFVVDTTAAVPTAVPLLTGQICYEMAWDSVHRRLYVTRQRIEAIDGDRSSPTFGTVLVHVPPIPSFVPGKLAVTADGTRLVHATQSGHFERYDADPASPTYLQSIPTPPPLWPVAFGTTFNALHVAPDGSVVTLVVTRFQFSSTELHRFDDAANAWIDHDPVAPGTQPMSFFTHALVPTNFTWHATRDGSAAYLTGGGGSCAMHLQLGGPGFSVHPSPLPPVGLFHHYQGATPSGRYLLLHAVVLPANELSLVDVATAATIPLAAVPPMSASGLVVAWR